MCNRWRDQSEYRHKLRDILSAQVEALAIITGKSPSMLYKRLEGEISMIPDDVADLFNASGEFEVVNAIVRKCDGLILARIDEAETNGSTDDEMEDLAINCGKFLDVRRKCAKRYELEEIARNIHIAADRLVRELEIMAYA